MPKFRTTESEGSSTLCTFYFACHCFIFPTQIVETMNFRSINHVYVKKREDVLFFFCFFGVAKSILSTDIDDRGLGGSEAFRSIQNMNYFVGKRFTLQGRVLF